MATLRKNAAALLSAIRPVQWVKNLLVLAPLFFAWGDAGQWVRADRLRCTCLSIAATAVFCIVSGAVYLFNDIRDREDDARHPIKKFRPVASGELGVHAAAVAASALLVAGLAASAMIGKGFLASIVAYTAMQCCYTIILKRLALLDVIVIAIGFVLRAVAGAVAIGVDISPWLILCTFFLSLFLALCKRRQEKVVHVADAQRISLRDYSVRLLDLLVGISATATIISYSLYTMSPATEAKFGTDYLFATIPFVVFGLFRYLHLVFARNEGERPERTLLTDGVIIATVFLYLTAFCLILRLGTAS